MKKLLCFCFAILPAAILPAQHLYDLPRTNAVYSTNLMLVEVLVLGTNGTQMLTVANLFSNRTLSGWAVLDGPTTNTGTLLVGTNLTLMTAISSPTVSGTNNGIFWASNNTLFWRWTAGGTTTNEIKIAGP